MNICSIILVYIMILNRQEIFFLTLKYHIQIYSSKNRQINVRQKLIMLKIHKRQYLIQCTY